MNEIATITKNDFVFSDNPEIAKHQAATIQHALNLSARIATDPVYNSTKQFEIKSKVQADFTTHLFNAFGILIMIFCFVFLISYASKIPVMVQPARTIETGDLESMNKNLQRELMITKSDLQTKIKEVEMLEREFKELKEKE